AETIHALAHLRAMGAVGTTADNLKAAIDGETHEFTDMYPAMIEAAKAEGHKAAARSFSYANEVEKVHAELYRRALENLATLTTTDYYVCAVCGHTVDGAAPEKCEVCGANSRAFEKID
ncbi:MAG: rubrerythrin family protein, partial [Desulfobulbaceae bacterium]|nr:rubrerythrin family protein [Desulfobulbaceae bacterium]